MHDFPVQKLCELVNTHGIILTEDAELCESSIREACGNDYKLEVFVLIMAIREGVAHELLNPPPDLPVEAWFSHLSQRLYGNSLEFLGLEKNVAEWAVQSWRMALSQLPTAKVAKPPKRLSPLNPLDHLRLLWWVLVRPQRLQVYRQVFGDEDENRIGKWLVSTLTWWPLLMPTLASGMELLLPSPDNWPPNAYILFCVLLVGCWLLTGRVGNEGEGSVMGNVAFGVVFSVVFGVTYVVAIVTSFFVAIGVVTGVTFGVSTEVTLGVAFIVAYVVAFYVAYVVAVGVAFGMRDTITNSLRTGTPSSVARLAFLLLVAAYLFLIWFCFFGGEQLLVG
ncbi:MAG: hypothetical protein DRR08_21535 [Candidatus Parabeggiatoa sp. nov. 2]|nr:MAG: hypothetical protein B6247_17220 [Beggiatoa sp. 4572_84]RKZ56525.1 MAG: hypothetical protein DRR08_21535 [Gammaproteobacteria bacterium]HEC86063.1 hypothetical protein [Thioploca sp.]